ncbi:unnamed protein product [Musa textilis]
MESCRGVQVPPVILMCSVRQQLESANLQWSYFDNKLKNATKDTNMKFRNPKFLSMLNQLRFCLLEMYLKLHKIPFFTALWKIDKDGKVKGAVDTCFRLLHSHARYMNLSPMNFFDLDAWRKEMCTE